MRYKTTNKALRNGYSYLIEVGYCDAQYLLSRRSPIAYTSGIYGWSADVYDIGDIVPGAAIVTGYRLPAGIKIDYKALREAEHAARNASEDEQEKLLADLVRATINGKGRINEKRSY